MKLNLRKCNVDQFFYSFKGIAVVMVLTVKLIADICTGIGTGNVVKANRTYNGRRIFFSKYIKANVMKFQTKSVFNTKQISFPSMRFPRQEYWSGLPSPSLLHQP